MTTGYRPDEIINAPRYAGFWPRFWAGSIDFIFTIPIIALAIWSPTLSRNNAALLEIPLMLAPIFFIIYFTGRWGQTLGKMALKIKVVAADGTPVHYRRAFLRSAVDILFCFISSGLSTYAILCISSADYEALSFNGRVELIEQSTQHWIGIIDKLSYLWAASELFSLLLNKKRRSLHDLIAGTIVIHIDEHL